VAKRKQMEKETTCNIYKKKEEIKELIP